MKKTQKCCFLPIIFVVFLLILQNFIIFVNFGRFTLTKNFCEANSEKPSEIFQRSYSIYFGKICFNFSSEEFKNEYKLSPIHKNFLMGDFNAILNKLLNMGFSKREICEYLLPEISNILQICKSKLNRQPNEDYVSVIKNSCKISYNFKPKGKFIDEEKFFDDVFAEILKNKTKISISLKLENYKKITDIRQDFQEKGYFETNFSTSSAERKNNITLALSKFDGIILEAGESFSFNKITGQRDEKAGYKAAKIIMNGTFVQGFGGGVCQVSTTIYNACLLAGLEILEVHQHSLPVSYVEPSFDAMVNSGSSDLVVRNNTDSKIIITTSSKGDICKVKIFGQKNKFKITRFSEKIGIIPAEPEVFETDYKRYGIDDLETGEEKRISYSKEGFYSNGYLKYYDENGELVETKKIRENKYAATRGVVIKREK